MAGPVTNALLVRLGTAATPAEAAGIYLAAGSEAEVPVRLVLLDGLRESGAEEADAMFGFISGLPAETLFGVVGLIRGLSPEAWDRLKGTRAWQSRLSTHAPAGEVRARVEAELSRTALARRAGELREFGVPNPDEVARVEKEMGFKLNLDPTAIRARAQELRSLFHRVELPLPPEFHQLDPGTKAGLIKVGRAMRLVDIAYRAQSIPHGDVFEELVMKTPVFEPLRDIYRRLGPYNYLQPDKEHRVHGALPGMENVILFDGAGLYPLGLTAEEFRAQFPDGTPGAKAKWSVFRNVDGQLREIPYAVAFKKWLEPAALELDQAAALLEQKHPKIANYLRAVARAFRNNDFDTAERLWIKLDEPDIDIQFTPVEVYEDGLRGILASFQGILHLRNHKDEEERLRPLVDLFSELEEALPVRNEYKLPKDERKGPPVFVTDALYSAGKMNSHRLPVAYHLPNDSVLHREVGHRIEIMANQGAERNARFPGRTRAIALMIHPDQRALVTAKGFDRFVAFHEVGHGNGRGDLIDQPGVDPETKIGGLYSSLEELRADIVGLHNAYTAFQLGKITEQDLHELYVTYVFRCLASMQEGLAEAHRQGAAVAINTFLAEGTIEMNPDTGETLVNLNRMPDAVKSFATLLQTLKGDGNKGGVISLYEARGSSYPDVLDAIYARLRAEGYPIALWVDYEFETLLDQ